MTTFRRNILESAADLQLCAVLIASFTILLTVKKLDSSYQGGEEIASVEGTTQGGPTAMPVYEPRPLPLVNITTADKTKHAPCPDDISYVGKLRNILT